MPVICVPLVRRSNASAWLDEGGQRVGVSGVQGCSAVSLFGATIRLVIAIAGEVRSRSNETGRSEAPQQFAARFDVGCLHDLGSFIDAPGVRAGADAAVPLRGIAAAG